MLKCLAEASFTQAEIKILFIFQKSPDEDFISEGSVGRSTSLVHAEVGVGTKLGTFKGNDRITLVLPRTNLRYINRCQISVTECASG